MLTVLLYGMRPIDITLSDWLWFIVLALVWGGMLAGLGWGFYLLVRPGRLGKALLVLGASFLLGALLTGAFVG